LDITLKLGDLTVGAKSFGGQLTSIKKGNLEYLWQGDPKWWHGQAPILFPIVGSLRDNKAMTSNGPTEMPRHGLTRKMEQTLSNSTDTSAEFEIRANEDTLVKYPYNFTLRTAYTLKSENTLETKMTVINNGSKPMPFAIGGHPAFNVPVDPSADEDFSDYTLYFTKKMTWDSPMMDDKGLYDLNDCTPLMKDSDTLNLSHDLLSHDVLTFKNVPDYSVTLKGNRTGNGVKLTFPGFDYLGLWSAANDAPFVAIEPWIGCSTCSDEDNVFEHKRGIKIVEAGEQFEAAFTIMLF
jgi:galactose mutarotase-like enzyme